MRGGELRKVEVEFVWRESDAVMVRAENCASRAASARTWLSLTVIA